VKRLLKKIRKLQKKRKSKIFKKLRKLKFSEMFLINKNLRMKLPKLKEIQ